jgi:protoporphyrinogen oxidase
VKGFADEANSMRIHLNSEVISINLTEQTVTTGSETYQYEDLITTIPLTNFLKLTDITCESPLAGNKVLVFNIGFDQPSPVDSHWIYIPDKDINFHRVGFYDNIFQRDRMSIYLEIGFNQNREIDISAEMNSAIDSLDEIGIVKDHDCLATHSVVMDPAYCYLNPETVTFVDKMRTKLQKSNVHLLGRYSEWEYCSVEDNVRDAKQLAAELNA